MRNKITKRAVDSFSASEKEYFIWDTEVKGFGLKVTPKAKKVYVLKYRMPGRSNTKRITIGTHGSPWTPEKARTEAIRLLGNVSENIDPSVERQNLKAQKTIAELCDQYLQEGVGTKKASTIATDKGRIERHIKPLIGKQYVKDLTSNDVRRFMNAIANGKTAVKDTDGRIIAKGGKGTASRTVGLLGGIFSFAVSEGMRADNPVKGVKRFPDKKNERFLSPTELSRLGEALVEAEHDGENPIAINAIRILLLTGCRKMEILALEWDEVDFDFGCLRLKDSKSGQKIIPLGKPALQLLSTMDRINNSDYVFPSTVTDRHIIGVPKVWTRVKKRAGLNDIRLHDLRHSFASVGAGAGMGLQIVGKLLGHADPKTTARYAHIADDPARAAADRISSTIEAHLSGNTNNQSNVINLKGD